MKFFTSRYTAALETQVAELKAELDRERAETKRLNGLLLVMVPQEELTKEREDAGRLRNAAVLMAASHLEETVKRVAENARLTSEVARLTEAQNAVKPPAPKPHPQVGNWLAARSQYERQDVTVSELDKEN